ncbi:MAG: type II toxin-antitoxin system RelE/ParE family toxin [Chitinophagaceae bacterium]|nr:type II toxin-antitoxin system RelE/ParE family toxin [Chitinophagaceae bacterium]
MNNFDITFSPLTLDDIEETFNYYEAHQTGLGKRFNSQLQLTLKAINRNPFFASVRFDDIRCAQIKKFLYLVHYHIHEADKLVTVIAVYSVYKNPFGT